jgi:hypothetical protein
MPMSEGAACRFALPGMAWKRMPFASVGSCFFGR